jgi:hypothetical protein
MIEFTREVLNPNCSTSRPRCDTSYILSIARPTYTADWQFDCPPCEGEISLSANITLDNDCPTFIGRLRTQLLWTSEDGDTLGITDGSGAITVDHPGVYCVEIEVILDDLFSCHVEAPSCINIPDVVFPDSVDIDGPTRLCEDSIATYFAPLSPDICEISWQVSDNGTIIKDTIINDSALVTISWDTAVQDTGLVCIDLKSDCGITTSCFITRICPISTEVTSTASIAPSFRYAGGWLHWSGLSPNGAARLSLISTDGRMILTNTIAQERGRLQLPSTPPGIYLIHWQIDDQRQGSLKIYLPSD